MTKDLLDQAYKLYAHLNKLLWDASYKQDINAYSKLQKVLNKALDRYERRFNKYRSNC